MTHDELLFKIYEIHNNSSDAGQEANKQYRGMIHFMQALRAVVKLHKPVSDNSCSDPGCCGGPYPDLCEICSEQYPCETIEAIEKELG